MLVVLVDFFEVSVARREKQVNLAVQISVLKMKFESFFVIC